MNCDDTTGLLSDRLKGLLTDDDERRLEAHLADCPACREEAAAVSALWSEMGTVEGDVPHARMRARFHAALAAYEQRTDTTNLDRLVEYVWPSRPAFQLGIAAALLFAGVLLGRGLQPPGDDDVAGLRQNVRTMSLALLDHQSASERLLGVEWSRRTGFYSPVIDALLDVARNDSNVNVRLAAVEALSESLHRPDVAAALTEALVREDTPLMQITLAEALLEHDVRSSVPAVRRMVEREGVDPSVQNYLRTVLQEIDESAPGGDLL